MNKIKQIKISDITSGPIRQEVLPEGFIVRVQKFKEILKEVETFSLEETISNFQRDHNPEKELAIWEHIASKYSECLSNNPEMDADQRRQIYSVILKSTMG